MAFNQQQAFDKVLATIKSCETIAQAKSAHNRLLNYIKIGPRLESVDPFYVQGHDVAELQNELNAVLRELSTYNYDEF